MKAIILAAGRGRRLGKYTVNTPKGMLNFQGQSLIERQVRTLRDAGISDISIVRGYQAEKIDVEGVRYYENKKFATTNMVETLFCAEEELLGDQDVLVCYADIIYEPRIVREIQFADVDIGVVVDEDYWDYWSARLGDPEQDMESLVVQGDKIIELGDPSCSRSRAAWRYVGLIKFSPHGMQFFSDIYHTNRLLHYEKDQPWLRSKSFKHAYMTCMLQAVVNEGYTVCPIEVARGWLEFDTALDYERYNQWAESGTLDRFMKVEKINARAGLLAK